MAISLPDFPTDHEFEEYISAFFQASGLFVERNLIQREKEEILELDIISTFYAKSEIGMTLVEVKSGGWGYPDLFKLLGWINYLDIKESRGLLVAQEPKHYTQSMRDKMYPFNINIAEIERPDFSLTKVHLESFLGTHEVTEMDIAFWRFSYWIERNMLKYLKTRKKSVKNVERYLALDAYNFEVTSGVFFTINILDRVHKLYSAFSEAPHLSAKSGHELAGDSFGGEYNRLPNSVFQETYFACKLNDIQISTYLESKARLAILKGAIDYIIYSNSGDLKRVQDKMDLLGISISIKDMLPVSFLQGLMEISKEPFFYLYPIFWQTFMFLFGGFILQDYQDQDYELLSKKSGIPIEEIPNALSAMDKLFPVSGSWFWNKEPNSNLRVLNYFSVPFMGLGAFYRLRSYAAENAQYKDLKVKGPHTLNDLAKWHNLTSQVLALG